jgi:hypothetical protein
LLYTLTLAAEETTGSQLGETAAINASFFGVYGQEGVICNWLNIGK